MELDVLHPVRQKRTYTQHPFSERKRAIELRERGLTSKEIGVLLHVDDSMVRSWIRKYHTYGEAGLQPYWRVSGKALAVSPRAVFRKEKDRLFKDAFWVYGSTLEPVSSITRRYKLDYHSFLYHVKRYHPELVERRESLKRIIIQNHTNENETNI